MRIRTKVAFFAISCWIFLTNLILAENQVKKVPTINAFQAEEIIKVDGLLQESIWQREGYSKLIQKEPMEGSQPTEKTSVLIAYDDKGIYVAAKCYHSGTDSITGGLARRDKKVESDWFWFWIDPNKDGQDGFGFAVNPDGSIIDQKLFQDIYADDDWDGVWEAGAKKYKDHWTAEMFIPFTQLRFGKKDEYIMGVNFERYILKNAEQDYFVMVPKIESGFVSKFGELKGIRGIKPPSRFYITPYFMGKANNYADDHGNPFYDDNKFTQNIGADLKYGLTGNLTFDLTLNPDFGQAELDPAQINLSAFETYYSEKRAFFIEGSDIFRFGSNPTPSLWGCNWREPEVFYSRRIGRKPKGNPSHSGSIYKPEQTTILGAGKISGRTGEWSIGGVTAITEREYAQVDSSGARFKEEIEPLSYYGTFRVARQFQRGDKGLGFIFTGVARDFNRKGLEIIYNKNATVVGVDGWVFLNKNREWAFVGKIAHSYVNSSRERIFNLQQEPVHYYQRPDFNFVSLDSNRTSLSGYMGRFGLLKAKGNVTFQSALGIISPGFDTNDLGFTAYTNLINVHIVTGYNWYKPTRWYRFAGIALMTSRNYDFDGNKLFEQYYVTGSLQLPNYWSLNSNFQLTPDGLDAFATRGGPLVAYHGYENLYLSISTDSRKTLQVQGSFNYIPAKDGGFVNEFEIDFVYKPRPSIKLTFSTSYTEMLEHQQWVANISDSSAMDTYGTGYIFADLDEKVTSATMRLDYGITPQLSLQLYVEPYIAVGHYDHFKRLEKPGTYQFKDYPSNDFDPDFNFKSLKANLVIRWEYLPGSLIYLVWTQNRENYDRAGIFNLAKDFNSLIKENSDDIFLLRLSYLWSF